MVAFDELHVCGGATPLPFIWAFENATISMCFKTQEGHLYVEKLEANRNVHVLRKTKTARINGSRLISVRDSF